MFVNEVKMKEGTFHIAAEDISFFALAFFSKQEVAVFVTGCQKKRGKKPQSTF